MTDSTIDWYEIKGRYMAGEKPRRLAQMYEIDPKQLSNIIVRQGWRKQREEIRLKVAEEFADARRELNVKAMQFVNLVLSSLIHDDGTLNLEACKTIKASVLRLCLQMALPEKVKIREVTHTFGEGPEPWRNYTARNSADTDNAETDKMSKNEQKSETQNNSPRPSQSSLAEPSDIGRTPVSKNEQNPHIQNDSPPQSTPPAYPQITSLMMSPPYPKNPALASTSPPPSLRSEFAPEQHPPVPIENLRTDPIAITRSALSL